jgi:hypothetical protein
MTGASRRLTPISRLHKLDHLKHSRQLWHDNVKNRKEVEKYSKPTLFYDILLYLYLNPRIDPRLTNLPWGVPRWHPSSKMNKTEMIWKNILSLVHFMTFCSILTTTAATAELVYIQWLNTSPQFYPNRKTKDFFIFRFFSWSAKLPPSLLH